ncbi:hypothetical protein L6452_18858 [Arctium lappa]|uniref:Uncharacterized protein n=1 Tax=Arctium lappa TaxID=4217 RepID=A0ACB9C7D2_ARCLA|nr:hypothetical protein L6452_18858 [Arctium lappa]
MSVAYQDEGKGCRRLSWVRSVVTGVKVVVVVNCCHCCAIRVQGGGGGGGQGGDDGDGGEVLGGLTAVTVVPFGFKEEVVVAVKEEVVPFQVFM